jgi:hypothetical protein
MGNHSELSMRPVTGESSRRRGIALPAALFGLAAVSVMAVGIFSMTDLQSKSVKNRESSARAMMLAEAGIIHALTVVRDTLKNKDAVDLFKGSDAAFNTEDDYLIVGYNLSAGAQIPALGKNITEGNYKVTIADDPADGDVDPKTDNNFRFLLNCTAMTTDGAKATLSAVVGNAAYPGVVTEGNLTINGDPEIIGKCGGAHANNVAIVSGNPTVTNNISATSVVQLSGSVENPEGEQVTPLQFQPPLEIPEVFPADYCGTADYTLNSNGTIVRKSDGASFNINSNSVFGWKRASSSPVIFDHDGSSSYPGTICAYGNVKVGGAPGSAANPLLMSIIATGSIQISGNPYLKPSSPDKIMFLAGGDVEINGNPSAGALSYEGLIYATSQCKVAGNPAIHGQIVCKNKPNPSPANSTVELAVENQISGNPKITYNCGGFRLTKLRFLSWYQTGT